MSQPTPYNRAFNFANQQASTPADPLPATQLENELNAIKLTLDEALANLALIQRDDTAVANQSIGYDQLKAELDGFGFNPPSNWATATNYVARDTVFYNNGFYRCAISHTSGDFATDLAAVKWVLIADFTAANGTLLDIGDGSGAGPDFLVYRDSASPAANDFLGTVKFDGNDGGDNQTTYAKIFSQIVDSTNGSEDGRLSMQAMIAGTLTTVWSIDSSGAAVTGDLTVAGGVLPNADSTRDLGASANAWRKLYVDEIVSEAVAGHLFGLTLSNNSTDGDHDIDIAVGSAASDDTAPTVMRLESGLTKQLDASWAVGTNAGGLDTGSIAANTTYHVWLIERSDTGVVDALFSTSASSPTMPTNYDRKRRIGSVTTDGSANIIGFTQRGDEFLLKTPVNFVTYTALGVAALPTAPVPTGIQVDAKISGHVYHATLAYVLITSPDQNDTAPSSSVYDAFSVSGSYAMYQRTVRTSTSGTLRVRSSHTNTHFYSTLHGWIDTRGRNA